jgi:hypothetical protein
MINSVRNTVLAILNKNNYGYLSPSDFNLFAKQAQLDIFRDYFYQLNYQINKENIRQSSSGISNLTKQYSETIERFIVPSTALNLVADNVYDAPSEITTGSDYFNILNIYCYDTSFSPKRYLAEADKISPIEFKRLEHSLMQKPSKVFPAYTLTDDKVKVLPETIQGANAVECQYIRYPKAPKWTFTSLLNGTPTYDPTKIDFQDFELPQDDEVELVVKICQYAGISIRESEVYQFAKQEEVQTSQSEQ